MLSQQELFGGPVKSGKISVRFLFSSTNGVNSDMVAEVAFDNGTRFIEGAAKGRFAGRDYEQRLSTYIYPEDDGFTQYILVGDDWVAQHTDGRDTMDVSSLFDLCESDLISYEEVEVEEETTPQDIRGKMTYATLKRLLGSTVRDIPSQTDLGELTVEITLQRSTGLLVSFDAFIDNPVDDVTQFKFGFSVLELHDTKLERHDK